MSSSGKSPSLTTTTSTGAPLTALRPDSSLDRALICAQAAIDKKAENLKILDLTSMPAFTDYFLICNGMSDRQTRSIADNIEVALAKHGLKPISTEGTLDGRWILIDYGDVVVHIFLDALRDYYDLERLWANAPRVKIPSEFYGPGADRLN